MSRRPTRRAPQRLAPRRPEPVQEAELDEEFDDDLDEDPNDEGYEDDEDEPLDAESADAFFAAEISTVRPAVLTLYGRTYTLPPTMPVAFSLLAERHRADESLETFRVVLAPVFGPDALDEWLANGIDERRLGIVLLWAAQNMHQPGSLSFPEAAREFDTREARGKANRAQRRAPSGARR